MVSGMLSGLGLFQVRSLGHFHIRPTIRRRRRLSHKPIRKAQGRQSPIFTQPKDKPNFQVTALKPKWVWAPRAHGLEKIEKAVEDFSSSPPTDLHLELGHDRVSVHSWDSESQLSLASVVPTPLPDCKPIDEIMQRVGVVDRSWGSS
jgi:hypothetical protein